jgi:hypothetical protein
LRRRCNSRSSAECRSRRSAAQRCQGCPWANLRNGARRRCNSGRGTHHQRSGNKNTNQRRPQSSHDYSPCPGPFRQHLFRNKVSLRRFGERLLLTLVH